MKALEADVRVAARDVDRHVAEQPVALRQHVVLGGAGDVARPARAFRRRASSKAKRTTRRAAGLGDDLQREATRAEVGHRPAQRGALEAGGSERLEVALDADVEVLQVLAHDHEVDALRAAPARCDSRAASAPGERWHTCPCPSAGRRAPARSGRWWHRRAPSGGVDRAPGRDAIVDRRVDPLDVQSEPVEQDDGRAHRLRRRVLALDDHDLRHAATHTPWRTVRQRDHGAQASRATP